MNELLFVKWKKNKKEYEENIQKNREDMNQYNFHNMVKQTEKETGIYILNEEEKNKIISHDYISYISTEYIEKIYHQYNLAKRRLIHLANQSDMNVDHFIYGMESMKLLAHGMKKKKKEEEEE